MVYGPAPVPVTDSPDVSGVPSPQLIAAVKSAACALASPTLNVVCSEIEAGPVALGELMLVNEIARMVEMRPASKSAVHKLPSAPLAMPVTPLNG